MRFHRPRTCYVRGLFNNQKGITVILVIKSTPEIATIRGTECRVWCGRTPLGLPCYVFVAALGTDEEDPTIEFDMEFPDSVDVDVTFPDEPAGKEA